jgi:hypothetical protein
VKSQNLRTVTLDRRVDCGENQAFAQKPDEQRELQRDVLTLPNHVWEGMGRPESVLVTIIAEAKKPKP